MWKYLTSESGAESEDVALVKGKLTHEYMQNHDLPPKIQKLVGTPNPLLFEQKLELHRDDYIVVGVPDVIAGEWIIDWKTMTEDKAKNRVKSMSQHAKQLNLYKWLVEEVMGHEIKQGALVRLNPHFTEGVIDSVKIEKVSIYELNPVWLEEWDFMFSTMYGSIREEIEQGYLDSYLSSY